MIHSDGELPMVFVHGWSLSEAAWGGFPRALAGQGEVMIRDLPGHGASPERPGWSPESLASEWLAELPNAIWVGASLGGQVALAAAAIDPERVRGLVLIGATPCFVQRSNWPFAMSQDTFETFRDGCARAPGPTLRRFDGLQCLGDQAARRARRHLSAYRESAGPVTVAALQAGLDVLEQADLRERLPEVRTPTLWLTGEQDSLVPPSAPINSADRQPRARVCSVPGAGHAPYLTHEEALVNATRQWLRDTQT